MSRLRARECVCARVCACVCVYACVRVRACACVRGRLRACGHEDVLVVGREGDVHHVERHEGVTVCVHVQIMHLRCESTRGCSRVLTGYSGVLRGTLAVRRLIGTKATNTSTRAHTQARAHTRTHTHTHTHTHAHARAHTHTQARTHTHMHTHARTCKCGLAHVRAHTGLLARLNTRARVRITRARAAYSVRG